MKSLFAIVILLISASAASASECPPGQKSVRDDAGKYSCVPADPQECSPGYTRQPATGRDGVVMIENGNIVFSCKPEKK